MYSFSVRHKHVNKFCVRIVETMLYTWRQGRLYRPAAVRSNQSMLKNKMAKII